MSNYDHKLERLASIIENNQWAEKRGEAITIINQLLIGTYSLSEGQRIQAILSEYIPLLLTIFQDEDEELKMRKAVFNTLSNITTDPAVLSEAIKLVKLGIEEDNFSWYFAQKLMPLPNTYPLLREAILELLQSPVEYHKILGLAIIRDYKKEIKKSGKKQTKPKSTSKTVTKPSSPTTTVIQDQFSNDWLLIVRYIVREGKSRKIKITAWEALATISDIADERRLLIDFFVYGALHEVLLKFQPNIQVPLPRIIELTTPVILEKISNKDFQIRSDSITKELYDQLIKDIIVNEDISGDYFELEQVFVRKDGKEQYSLTASTFSKSYLCYNCGMPVEKDATTCPSCNQEILRCNVCKLPISFGEEAGKCSLCESKGHMSHFQEWVKVKGKCPTCMKKIPIEGVVPLIGELKK